MVRCSLLAGLFWSGLLVLVLHSALLAGQQETRPTTGPTFGDPQIENGTSSPPLVPYEVFDASSGRLSSVLGEEPPSKRRSSRGPGGVFGDWLLDNLPPRSGLETSFALSHPSRVAHTLFELGILLRV